MSICIGGHLGLQPDHKWGNGTSTIKIMGLYLKSEFSAVCKVEQIIPIIHPMWNIQSLLLAAFNLFSSC